MRALAATLEWLHSEIPDGEGPVTSTSSAGLTTIKCATCEVLPDAAARGLMPLVDRGAASSSDS